MRKVARATSDLRVLQVHVAMSWVSVPDVLLPANSGSNLANVDVASGLDSNDASKLRELESAAKLFPHRV